MCNRRQGNMQAFRENKQWSNVNNYFTNNTALMWQIMIGFDDRNL